MRLSPETYALDCIVVRFFNPGLHPNIQWEEKRMLVVVHKWRHAYSLPVATKIIRFKKCFLLRVPEIIGEAFWVTYFFYSRKCFRFTSHHVSVILSFIRSSNSPCLFPIICVLVCITKTSHSLQFIFRITLSHISHSIILICATGSSCAFNNNLISNKLLKLSWQGITSTC